ncbi:MAG: amidohydrolase family protein [Chloroflexota bacterium]
MIIDFHTHIFPPKVKEDRDGYFADPLFKVCYSSPKSRVITADDLVQAMDREGIDVSVVMNLGWSSPELCRETNDYILESVARYPERLAGFCMVQPLSGEQAVREIERCAAAGARGIGEMVPDVQGFPLNDDGPMKPVAEELVRRNLILLLHASEPVGHEYPGKLKDTPEILYPFILKHPELKTVLAHWGGGLPFYALMPEVARALGNVYFDTSATPYLYLADVFRCVSEIIGANRVLFGSDYPLLSPQRIIDQVGMLGFSVSDRTAILGGNAERLLGWASK